MPENVYEVSAESVSFTQEQFERYGLWRFMPVINVDRTKDIPGDWPGLMGVPITYIDKHDKERFEIVDQVKPMIGERALYRRIIIRNKRPKNTGKYRVFVTYEVEDNVQENPLEGA